MYQRLLLLLGLVCVLHAEEEHHFAGKHFFASYLECDALALSDLNGMISAMDDAVKASGATLLNMTPHVFPPNAVTAVYLLSESHASIHTYPEHGSCFVDLFTCGDNCSSEKFDSILRAYLKPKRVSARFFERSEETTEVPYSLTNEVH
jgi:S-adenosylmethionine decarboxylase proenzyme